MLSRCFLDFSAGVGAFVIGLSQISSFSHKNTCNRCDMPIWTCIRYISGHQYFPLVLSCF